MSLVLKSSIKLLQTPFIPCKIILSIFIKDKIIIVLIYRVIRQMHKGVLDVTGLWLRVRDSGHSDKTVVVKKYTKRVATSDKNV